MTERWTARLFFHPQRGAFFSKGAINPVCARYRGGSDEDWQELGSFQLELGAGGLERGSPNQTLPQGFLWAEPSGQRFGLGGPFVAYGPLQKVCRTCGEPFVFTAEEQKHWYEVRRIRVDVLALHCGPCRQRRLRRAQAQRAYMAALQLAQAEPDSCESQLAVSRSALELLDAGGSVAFHTVLFHTNRAADLGARETAEPLRDELRARMAR